MIDGKECPTCGEYKLANAFFKSTRRTDGLRYNCKSCSVKARREWAKRNPEKAKTLDVKYREQNRERYRQNTKKWVEENAEKKRRADREYRKAHASKLRARSRDWREKNAEVLRRRKLEYREANVEKVRAKDREWKRLNPDKVASANARRRAHRKHALPRWLSPEQHRAIQRVYAEARRRSEQSGVPHHVDHIVPLVSEEVCGLHVPWNLQVLPWRDNLAKGNTLVDAPFVGPN